MQQPAKKILFADDDPQISRLIVGVLEENGFEVVHAGNGREALAAAAAHRPDLAILDIVMPVLDGIETAAMLRRQPATAQMPIIALTAAGSTVRDAGQDESSPWSATLQKPVKVRQLVKLVGSLTGQPDLEPKINWSRLTTALWSEKYAAQTRGRVEAELARLAVLDAAPHAPDLLEATRVMAHQLSGSASTFGYHKVAYIAREMESRVLAWRDALVPPAEREIDYLTKKLEEILTLLPRIQAKAPAATPAFESSFGAEAPSAARKRIVLLHDDPEFAKTFARLAHKRDLRVESFDTLAALTKRVEAHASDLVVLGGIHTGRGDYDAVRRLHSVDPDLPIFVLAAEDSTPSRVAAVRAGAKRFLHVTQEPANVVDACVDFLAAGRAHGGRIMVLDDDSAVLDLVEPTLTANGCEVYCLSDPATLFERLRAVNPDALLCDIDMPGINGVELTRALRASEHWSQLPILVMSRYSGFEQRAEAYQAGADDFLAKPLVADELVVRVTSRLEREALKRGALERDPLTALLNRKTFFARASQAIQRCGGDGRDLTLAVVELEHLTTFVQAHGMEAADAAIKAVGECLEATFGMTASVIGRLAGPFFAVLEYDTTVDELAARLESGLEPLAREKRLAPDERSPETVGITAGVVACLPEASLADLIDRAAAAKRNRNRVSVYKLAHGAGDGRAPIYLVDDDKMLCEMLAYALQRAGFHCEVYHAGDDALRALLEAPAHGSRPVVLLDIDLPRMDGMSVLRELETERPGRYQVVLLTAHGGEAAQIEGLRSSAVDYMVKPINVPLVIEKIRKLADAARV